MKESMQRLRESSIKEILAADSLEALEALRVKYLGKKGELTAILKQMGKLSAEERPVMGQLANQLRAEMEEALDKRREALGKELMEKKLVDALKSMLGIYAKVRLVAPKSIARSEGKAVRIIDKRKI